MSLLMHYAEGFVYDFYQIISLYNFSQSISLSSPIILLLLFSITKSSVPNPYLVHLVFWWTRSIYGVNAPLVPFPKLVLMVLKKHKQMKLAALDGM